MEKSNKHNRKLVLHKETLKILKVKSGVKTGAKAGREVTQYCPSVEVCPSLSECTPTEK